MVNDEPKTRARGSNDDRGAKFDFKNIFSGGKIGLELSLSIQDRELIGDAVDDLKEKVDEMSAKVDYRWKVTQWLMGIAIALGTIGQVINWAI
tara:strand:- start:833 stop:1111 length:279 start_codon:yes stop_codon:yes gene_type:complete